jgi:6-phosphogluconate dehydrogenase
MEIGFIGLGKMGLNMVTRLVQHKIDVVGFAPHKESVDAAKKIGAKPAYSIKELVGSTKSPRIIWLMVPAGQPTEDTINQLTPLLNKNDIVIDGGNSFYKDSIRRAQLLDTKGIHFLDIGVSGGIWGLKIGYCMMAGGDKKIFKQLEPALKILAPKDGYALVGPNGAGHFVKMVHNGIEYAMLQAYGEGFEIIKAKQDFTVDLGQIAHLWNQGSVIRSWLLELTENVFKKDPNLDSVLGYVEDSGEGRWSIAEAISESIPASAITASLFARFHSRQAESFSAKVIAALRNEFGGHKIKETEHGQKKKK